MKVPDFPNAACIGYSELFYINLPYTSEERAKEKQAKQRCLICPHIDECRDYAMAHEDHGIWGGTSEKERAALRRQMNIVVERPERHIIEAERIAARKRTFNIKYRKVVVE